MAIAVEVDGADQSISARRIVHNFAFLAIGKTLGDSFTFALFVVLSRVFGQEGVGLYSFAIGLTGFFAVFSALGLNIFTIKGLSRHAGSLQEYYSRILSLRFTLSVAVVGALLVVVPFLHFPGETRLIIILVGAYLVLYNLVEGISAVFIGKEDTRLAGLLEASLRGVGALTAVAVAVAGGSLVMALTSLPVVAFLHLLVAYGLVTKRYGRPRLVLSISSLTRTASDAIPYALSRLSLQLYSRVDVVFLGFILGVAAAGVYNVAFRVVFMLMSIPQLVSFALLPQVSRLYESSPSEHKALYHKSVNLGVLFGLPVAAGVWLVAPDFVDLVFGRDFQESATVLRILAGVLFLTFLSRTMGVFLVSCDRQVERAKSLWAVAFVGLLGNAVLIPFFGIKGAAVATLISEVLLVFLYAVRLSEVLGWPKIDSRLVISGVGVASFGVPFLLLPSLSLGVVIPVSALLYSVTLVLFKETRRNEVRMLAGLLKRKPASQASKVE